MKPARRELRTAYSLVASTQQNTEHELNIKDRLELFKCVCIGTRIYLTTPQKKHIMIAAKTRISKVKASTPIITEKE